MHVVLFSLVTDVRDCGAGGGDNSSDGTSFNTGYLRQWRFKDNDEWGIAVEVLRPL